MTDLTQFGVDSNADRIGMTAAATVGGAVALHAAVSALKAAQRKTQTDREA